MSEPTLEPISPSAQRPARSRVEAMFRFAFTVGDEEGWPHDSERPATGPHLDRESQTAHRGAEVLSP